MKRRFKQPEVNSFPRAILYARGSKEDQELTLDFQQARCRAYAASIDLEIGSEHQDSISSRKLERPGLAAAIADLQPGDILVVYKIDRLVRSVVDFYTINQQIEARGASVAFVNERFDTSTAVGRACLNVLLSFAQLERDLISERTIAGLSVKKERGERLGATPTGYRLVDGALVPDEEEQRLVARARALRAENVPLRRIGEILTAEGFKAKRGGKFGASAVAKLVGERYVETIAGAA